MKRVLISTFLLATLGSSAQKLNDPGKEIARYSRIMTAGTCSQVLGIGVVIAGIYKAENRQPYDGTFGSMQRQKNENVSAYYITGGVLFLFGSALNITAQSHMRRAGLSIHGNGITYNLPLKRKARQ